MKIRLLTGFCVSFVLPAAVLTAAGLSGCQTTKPRETGSEAANAASTTDARTEVTPPNAPKTESIVFEKEGGDAATRTIYFDLFYALQAVTRSEAEDEDRLIEYNQRFDKTGKIELNDNANTILCTQESCTLTWATSTISGDANSTAGRLFRGFGLAGASSSQVRRSGNKGGSHVECKKTASKEDEVSFACQARKLSEDAETADVQPTAANSVVPGPEACAAHADIREQAESARSELVGGGLLPMYLTADVSGDPAGFVRYTDEGENVQFVDMYLCGKMTHSYFYIDGNNDAPKSWLPASMKIGATTKSVRIVQDEAELATTVKLAAKTAAEALLEMQFKIVPLSVGDVEYGTQEVASDAEGQGSLYFKFPSSWF